MLESLLIKTHTTDLKINSNNVFATIKFKDYIEIAESIKNNNELQRRRVNNPSTVYALLKEDIIQGCIIPPIVLALDIEETIEISGEYSFIEEVIRKNGNHLKIIDGLQRTNILLDLKQDLESTLNKSEDEIEHNQKTLESIFNNELRLEIYLNISRFGILYRMLTLNTGQTPMSLRHQIEILYSDYYLTDTDGITLLRDAFDTTKPVKLGQYKFSDVVEGVTSYIDGSEFTLDRFDLLNYTKSIKKLSQDQSKIDIFKTFLELFHNLLKQIINIADGWKFDYDSLTKENLDHFPVQQKDRITGKQNRLAPFGRSAEEIFIKSQVFTGLGAAISTLRDKSVINEIPDLNEMVWSIKFETTPANALDTLVVRLEQIRKDSKKIGESQRTFFKHFFISLFNMNDEDAYLTFEKATESAFRKTI